jgi:hypothetical protein
MAAAVMIGGCASDASEPHAVDMPGVVDTTPPTSDSLEQYLVGRIELAPGHSVSFYEPEAGTVGMIETRDAGIKDSVIDGQLDVGRVYAALRPGQPMPPALRAALQRAAAIEVVPSPVAGERAGERASGGGARHASLRTAVDPDSYVNNATACDIAFVANQPATWSMCKIDWGGGFFAADGGANVIHGRVAVVQGTVTGRVQVGSAIFDHTITANTIAVYSFGNSSAGMRRIDILNAEGDWFHVSAKFRICTSSSCASNTWM